MYNEVILLKYGEVVMKGLNRGFFDNLLVRRVTRVLSDVEGEFNYTYSQSTLCIRANESADMETAFSKMKKVFGVATVCKGYECEKSMESISALVREKANALIGGSSTFKCESKRSDKSFPLSGPEICTEIGGVILDICPFVVVDVHNPEVTVVIEIRDTSAFVHGKGEKGAGGMPVGSAGNALLLLSGGIDSPVAGYMMAKRGITVDAVYFESPPYTSESAREKVISLAKKLSEYTGKVYLHTVSVTKIQETLMQHCEQRMFTLLLRRFMMRLAEKTALSYGASALITGESIGQVASQTLPAIIVTDSVPSMPVFRPCIGMDKDEIVVLSRKAGFFDISILPYEDCCTVFTPKHPNIRPTIEEALAEEAKLDVNALVEEAFATKKVIKIR